jgi:hypothetical protein
MIAAIQGSRPYGYGRFSQIHRQPQGVYRATQAVQTVTLARPSLTHPYESIMRLTISA